jgi:hypothetical protein
MNRALVVLSVLLLSACTPAPTRSPTPAATATATTTAGPTAVPGGCGDTPLWTGAAPEWIASAGGGLGQLPFALSHEGNLYAGLFAQPLRAGTDVTNPSNKILWISREPRDGQSLRLTLRRTDGTGPVLTQEEPANSGPGEIYPSIVDVPTAGCWSVTADWAGHRATLELPWN